MLVEIRRRTGRQPAEYLADGGFMEREVITQVTADGLHDLWADAQGPTAAGSRGAVTRRYAGGRGLARPHADAGGRKTSTRTAPRRPSG